VADLEKITQQNVIHVLVKQLSEVKAAMTSTVIFPSQCQNSVKGQTQLHETDKVPRTG